MIITINTFNNCRAHRELPSCHRGGTQKNRSQITLPPFKQAFCAVCLIYHNPIPANIPLRA